MQTTPDIARDSVGSDRSAVPVMPASESARLLYDAFLGITRRLEADASQFALYDPANDLLLSYALTQGGRIIPHPADFPTRIRATESGCFELLRGRREPRTFDPDVEPESCWPGSIELHRRFGTRTILVVPVHFGARFAGCMGLAFKHGGGLSPEDRPFVEALARQAGVAAELLRLAEVEQQTDLAHEGERAARDRAAMNERRAQIFESIAAASRDLLEADDFEVGLVAWLNRVARAAGADAAGLGEYQIRQDDGRVIPRIRASWSSRFSDAPIDGLHGVDEVPETSDFAKWTARILREETVWATLSDLKDPASRRYWGAEGCAANVLVPVYLAGRDKGFLSFDFFTERPYDAEMVAVIQTAAAGLGAALRRYAAYCLQLAEREAFASQVSKANAALQATVDAVANLKTIDALMPRVLEIVTRAFDAAGAGYFENSDELIWHRYWLEGGRLLAATDLPNLDPQHLPTMQLLVNGFWVTPEHLGIDVNERTRPTIIHHRTASASPALHAFCRSRGWDWELNIPLFVNGRTDAAITLFRAEERPFTEADVSLAESLGKQISLARQVSRLGQLERETLMLREREQASLRHAGALRRSTDALQRTVDVYASVRTLDEYIPEVLRIVADAFGAQSCAYCEQPTDTIYLRYWYRDGIIYGPAELPGLGDDDLAVIRRLAVGLAAPVSDLSTDAVGRTAPVIVNHRELRGDPEIQRFCLRMGWDVELNIPLLVDARAVGGLVVYRSAPGDFSDDEIALGAALGKQLALAMQVTQQAEREREITVARARSKELTRANRVLKQTLDVVASEADLKKVLGQVLRAITQQLNAESSAIWLLDDRASRFKIHLMWRGDRIVEANAELGPPPKNAPHRDRDLTLKRHIQERRPIVYDVESFRDTDAEVFEYFERLGLTTLLGIPLLMGEDVVGSLTVRFDKRSNLADEDVALAQAMAHQVTLAIQLTRLGEQASQAAVTEERARFARDVHDSLAQGFTGILMQLGAASQISGSDRSQIAPHLAAIGNLARSSLAEARRSVLELRRISAVEKRFEDRIEQLVERMRLRTSASILLQIDGTPCQIPVRAQTELLGIAQEAMVNAVKHAACTTIQNSVECTGPEVVRISVKDDGVGFDSTQQTMGDSFGILGMQERAALIGASLTIVSEKGRGTEIVVQYRTAEQRI